MSVSAVEKALGFGNGIISKWNKQSPSCDNIIKLADYLNCSVEYLLTGKESSHSELTEDEQQLMDIYRELTDCNKSRLSERGLSLIEQQKSADNE